MSTAFINGYYNMTTNPPVKLSLEYFFKREGSDVYYRFVVHTEPMTGSDYFGYNILFDLSVDNKQIISAGKIKDSMPSQWSEETVTYFPHRTAWYHIGSFKNDAPLHLPASCRFYSSQTSGSANSGDRYIYIPSYDSDESEYKDENEDGEGSTGGDIDDTGGSSGGGGGQSRLKHIYVKNNGVWTRAKNVYVKSGGVWQRGKKVRIKVNGVWKEV